MDNPRNHEYECTITATYHSGTDGGEPGSFQHILALPIEGVTGIWVTDIGFAGIPVTGSVPNMPFLVVRLPDLSTPYAVQGKIAGGIVVTLTGEQMAQQLGGGRGMQIYSAPYTSVNNRRLTDVKCTIQVPGGALATTADLDYAMVRLRVTYRPNNMGRFVADQMIDV